MSGRASVTASVLLAHFTSFCGAVLCCLPALRVLVQFNPALPPPPPQKMCFLPADVEFNARHDTRNILSALAGQLPLAAAARAEQPCFYQPGV